MSNDKDAVLQTLSVAPSSDGASQVTFAAPDRFTLGSARRRRMVHARIARALRDANARNVKFDTDSVSARIAGETGSVTLLIEEALAASTQERLYPRMVEEALNITARERLRWTKDRRLPQSGSGAFGRGRQSVSFTMYAFDDIARLRDDLSIIHAWRDADAMAAQR